MSTLRTVVTATALFAGIAGAQTAPSPLLGRWDLTLTTPGGERPSWLEVEASGRDVLLGMFTGVVGNARPIAHIVTRGDSLRFAIPHQWEQGDGDLVVEGRQEGDRLVGRMTFPDGRAVDWTGVRAPSLKRSAPPVWGAPIALVGANSLAGWRPVETDRENQWVVVNGVLRSPKSGVNIRTDRTFEDFKLHIEFRYPAHSNSGVYLRGRHEVQIQDDSGSHEPASHKFSGVYGFLAPTEWAAKPPGQWQSYDITLVGRMVTVVVNGKTVICNREIPGLTGGALDSKEGEPGPIMLQGDHGPIEYRNIILTPAR